MNGTGLSAKLSVFKVGKEKNKNFLSHNAAAMIYDELFVTVNYDANAIQMWPQAKKVHTTYNLYAFMRWIERCGAISPENNNHQYTANDC